MPKKTYHPDPDDSGILFNLPEAVADSPKSLSNFSEESDSDGAPEEIPFIQSKQSAISVLQAEEKGKKEVGELKKRKRQKNEALLKEQKEEKLKRLEILASKKLPEDILDNLSSAPSNLQEKKSKRKDMQAVSKQSHKRFDSDHYIPLDTQGTSTEFNIAVLQTKKWKDMSKPGSNPASNFRLNALNNSKIKRISVGGIHQTLAKQTTADKFKLVGL